MIGLTKQQKKIKRKYINVEKIIIEEEGYGKYEVQFVCLSQYFTLQGFAEEKSVAEYCAGRLAIALDNFLDNER